MCSKSGGRGGGGGAEGGGGGRGKAGWKANGACAITLCLRSIMVVVGVSV